MTAVTEPGNANWLDRIWAAAGHRNLVNIDSRFVKENVALAFGKLAAPLVVASDLVRVLAAPRQYEEDRALAAAMHELHAQAKALLEELEKRDRHRAVVSNGVIRAAGIARSGQDRSSGAIRRAPGTQARPHITAETADPSQEVSASPESDLEGLRSFWRSVLRYQPQSKITLLREPRSPFAVVLSGWAMETVSLGNGRRQVLDFLLPGDLAVLESGSSGSDRVLEAITRVELIDAFAPALAGPRPPRAAVAANAAGQQRQRMAAQVARLGRLTPKQRTLNLLLEFHDRLAAVGLAKDNTYRMPLTADMLADALGLRVEQLHRTLGQLRADGLVTLRQGEVTLHRPQELAAFACYQRRTEAFAQWPYSWDNAAPAGPLRPGFQRAGS